MLHLGGDVGSDMLHVLHPHGDVRSVVEVVNGVFLGSIEGAVESVRAGQHPASDFRWGFKFFILGFPASRTREPLFFPKDEFIFFRISEN